MAAVVYGGATEEGDFYKVRTELQAQHRRLVPFRCEETLFVSLVHTFARTPLRGYDCLLFAPYMMRLGAVRSGQGWFIAMAIQCDVRSVASTATGCLGV